MARSRYKTSTIIDDKEYGTFIIDNLSGEYEDKDLLKGIKTTEYTFKAGDRLDHLAAKYFNDDKYWWVIALANNIAYPFISPGTKLKIPLDVNDILNKLF